MAEATHALILDLLAWVAAAPRTYGETMDAWRSSCPRLAIWEDALDAGYLACARDGAQTTVRVTPLGHEMLRAERPAAGSYPSNPVIRRTSSGV